MARIIIAIVALAALLLLGRWLRDAYRQHGRAFAIKALLVAIAVLLVVLAATGRVHWIGALAASTLAGLRFLLPALLKSLPLLQGLFTARASAQQPDNQTKSSMTIDEAYAVLGLESTATREDIIDAHRRLIQKLHPDRGGNQFLATQLNQAKDMLLG